MPTQQLLLTIRPADLSRCRDDDQYRNRMDGKVGQRTFSETW
jgi:hypothetical protein